MSRSDISNRNCTVYDFESNYLDLEVKTRHEADSVVGREKRGMALKQRYASAVKSGMVTDSPGEEDDGARSVRLMQAPSFFRIGAMFTCLESSACNCDFK